MMQAYPPYPRRGTALPLIAAGAAFVLTIYVLVDRFAPRSMHAEASPRPVAASEELAEYEKRVIEVYERNRASVVHITSPEVGNWSTYEAYPEGTGTGFVWDERGYVVTNYHVVMGRSSVIVRLINQVEYDAAVVDARPDLDIAVVKITNPPSDLQGIEVGTSNSLRVGQTVLAIGNPFGLDHSLTVGVISALDRTITSPPPPGSERGAPIPGVIQVDAAINPGNSGGPLLDSSGHLIGMNTAIKSPSGANAGIGFAIPVDRINRVVPRLISGEQLPRAVLGFDADYYENRLMVNRVVRGSGAERAGLLGLHRSPQTGRLVVGDLIIAVNDQPVRHLEDLQDAMRSQQPGDRVKVEIVRGLPYAQERRTLEVELSARDSMPK